MTVYIIFTLKFAFYVRSDYTAEFFVLFGGRIVLVRCDIATWGWTPFSDLTDEK